MHVQDVFRLSRRNQLVKFTLNSHISNTVTQCEQDVDSGGSRISETGMANAKGGANLLFAQSRKCMKIKTFWWKRGSRLCAPFDPPVVVVFSHRTRSMMRRNNELLKCFMLLFALWYLEQCK